MISIVMVYLNRNVQFRKTLDSYLKHTPLNGFEIVVVEEHKNANSEKWHNELKDIVSEYSDRIKIIVVNDPFIGHNPCQKLNLAIRKSSGDMLMITNPEILHKDNVMIDAERRLLKEPRQYIAYACRSIVRGREDQWYQHSRCSPRALHYCTVTTRKTWDEIGGFDERYHKYICWEDNDLVRKISVTNIPIIQVDSVVTHHQEHDRMYDLTEDQIQFHIAESKKIFRDKWGHEDILYLR